MESNPHPPTKAWFFVLVSKTEFHFVKNQCHSVYCWLALRAILQLTRSDFSTSKYQENTGWYIGCDKVRITGSPPSSEWKQHTYIEVLLMFELSTKKLLKQIAPSICCGLVGSSINRTFDAIVLLSGWCEKCPYFRIDGGPRAQTRGRFEVSRGRERSSLKRGQTIR